LSNILEFTGGIFLTKL